MTWVWIAQCLCPQRHCILSAAGEADSEADAVQNVEAPLREQIADALQSTVLNPWCGLCRAPSDEWFYDLGRTGWRTLDEAIPAMKEFERQQTATAAAWRKPDQPLH
jgi:hypothetical protein